MKIAVSGEHLGHALPSTLNISINYFRPVSVNEAHLSLNIINEVNKTVAVTLHRVEENKKAVTTKRKYTMTFTAVHCPERKRYSSNEV